MVINYIKIKNVFKHKNTYIEFKDGINYLIGPNESGKTVILEMILYSLFGTITLRSEASDYKDSSVTLSLNISGTEYIIERNKKTTLYKKTEDSGEYEVITTGTKPTNLHIIQLLGYDSTVFYKTNYSTQLDGHSHATAKRSERINLINKVNGIEDATKLEKVLEIDKKYIKSEMRGLDQSQNFNNLKWVSKPSLENLDKDSLNLLSTNIKLTLEHINNLKQQLSALNMIPTLNEEDIEKCKNLSQSLYKLPDTSITHHGIVEHYNALLDLREEYDAYKETVSKYERYIDNYEVKYENNDVTEELVNELESKVENNKIYYERQRLLANGTVTCPDCNHSFPVSVESINKLEGGEELLPVPDINTIKSLRRYVDNHLITIKDYKNKLIDLVPVTFDKDYFNTIKTEYDLYQKLIASKQQYEDLKNIYTQNYDNSTSRDLNNHITVLTSKLSKLETDYQKLDTYLREKEVYQTTIDLKNQIQNKIRINNRLVEQYDLLINKSKEVRLSIQNSCIPSLNKKASNIINKMTGAQHYSLTVSDTFELLLDGNLLSKYSGSTQVISSVAFRIALMDLFYKKIFPLFIGDEVDSFADEDRASFVRNAFNVIANEGYQLILISHFKQEDLDGNIININDCKGK